MPDVATSFLRAQRLVVRGDVDLLQDLLGRHNLVRAHHQQQSVTGQDAVTGEDVQ
ncbi:hypothetical protein D3C74_464640 [compost metagenome]